MVSCCQTLFHEDELVDNTVDWQEGESKIIISKELNVKVKTLWFTWHAHFILFLYAHLTLQLNQLFLSCSLNIQ